MNQQTIKKEIQKEKIIAGDTNLRTIAGAIDRLQKAFPRYGSFLMEFLQNADDAKSTKIKIEIEGDEVKISNNGNPFSKEDVQSISDIARSQKSPKNYIGYLGVGFKSVFLVSDCPRIYSNGFSFKFDKNQHTNPKKIPWQIVPYWIEDDPQLESGFQTTFIFKVKQKGLLKMIREEVKPEHINERILLFLRNITEIHIVDRKRKFERIIRKKTEKKSRDHQVVNIHESIGKKAHSSKWLLFRKTFSVPTDVKKDYITIDWERGNIKKREVVIAYKLTENGKLQIEEHGTAHIGVFSFLPLKEIESGLKFLIHADFLTTPGRSELARECKWNEWLADCCKNLITDKCIESFKKHSSWKYNYTNILEGNLGGHELFKKRIIEPIEEFLDDNLLLVAEDGTLCKPDKLIKVQPTVRSLFTKADLKEIYPNKKVVHPECEYLDNGKTEEEEKELERFFEQESFKNLVKLKARQKNIRWFNGLFKVIIETYTDQYFYNKFTQYNVEHDNFWNKFRDLSTPIILTTHYGLVKINECFANPKKLSIPDKLSNKPKIVHNKIYSNEYFKKLLYKLNKHRKHYSAPDKKVVEELTKQELRDLIFKEEFDNLSKHKWEKYSDNDKIERIRALKSFYSDDLVNLAELKSKITLKSKNGKWVKPDEILFGAEFTDTHQLENIVQNGLYDKGVLFFLSPDFLDTSDYKETKEWAKFFSELGVNSILEGDENKKHRNQIVERIAVLATMKYERKKKRKPIERAESAPKTGWDIDSTGRKIEVKGTKQPTGFDLMLSPNEQKALFTQDNYYIYVVTNTLNEPTLSVVKGDILKSSNDREGIRFNYTYKAWNETTGAKIDEYKFDI